MRPILPLSLLLAACSASPGDRLPGGERARAPGVPSAKYAEPPSAPAPPPGGDTGVDCASPIGSGDTDGGTGEDTDHGSPENLPYDVADFDDVANCASCHPDHYDEWQGSIHAYSATNPVMWAGSKLIGETTDFPQNCIGCHAPIATLAPTLPPNVVVSSKSQLSAPAQHGVSCVSCHKLYDVYNGVNQFTHCRDHYFGTLEDAVDTPYHGNQHSEIHGQALVCRSCHNVENINRLQVEHTYTEWLDVNRLAGGAELEPAIQTCQDCHMPAYEGKAAVGGPDRIVHRHTFVGADVALTPFPDAHRQYRAVEALMKTAAAVAITPIYEGEGGVLSAVEVAVTNTIEGHDLPSGSAFDRQVWIEIFVTDALGNALIESGTLDANGDLRDWNSTLEPSADPWIDGRLSVFRSYLSDEFGQETFDFIGGARSIEDDSLVSGETRDVRYDLAGLVADAPLPLAVEVRLLYRPFPPFLLREHGLDESLVRAVPIFEITRDSLVLDTVTE